MRITLFVPLFFLLGCVSPSGALPLPDQGVTARDLAVADSAVPPLDAGVVDSAHVDLEGPSQDSAIPDAAPIADGGCEVSGAPGTCISTTTCAGLGEHASYAGHCPGPASIECCIVTPSVSNNPPFPTGYVLMQQSMVTAAMTAWAVMILNDPTHYPMFSTTLKTFGKQLVLARVEWHPPDFQNGIVHRGVTLYVPKP
jgi:hypothetical protein